MINGIVKSQQYRKGYLTFELSFCKINDIHYEIYYKIDMILKMKLCFAYSKKVLTKLFSVRSNKEYPFLRKKLKKIRNTIDIFFTGDSQESLCCTNTPGILHP